MATITKSPAQQVHTQASTRQGAKTWLIERATSVALLPLSLWFVLSAFGLAGAGYEETRAWLSGPFNTTCMILFVVTLFWHAQLGVRVIVEDYVHHELTKIVSLLMVNFAAIALGLACVVAILKVSLGS
jgi:succinate dehydrogenase / fumarate reductase membrane anchor subunit